MNHHRPESAPNLAAVILQQATSCPSAVAIIDDSGPVTYGELAARIRAQAARLQAHHPASEQPVGVLMARSAELVAVLIAVMHVGAAYVPLDPDDPPERTRRILESSGVTLVLGEPPSFAALQAAGVGASRGHALQFVDVRAAIPAPAVPPSVAPGGDRLAYILFTSGSTGAPKGVEICHASVINLLFAARDLLRFTAADRYLAASTVGFDISVAELFLPLVTGGSLLLRDRRIWLNPRQLADDLRAHGVTVLQMGPSVWSVMLAQIPDFPPLRVAISTGEPVAPALARRIAARAPETWNLYGPTETTVWSTAHRLSPIAPADEPRHAISAPIGQPIAHTTVLVVDDAGREVAPGETGELLLGGAGVARGYRGNPELTAERFITRGPAAERFYRTGDRVAWNRDGALEYFGRNDDQLKIRGVRIEPREVESALLEHAAVAQAAATWYDGAGSRSIVAAVVIRGGHTLTGPALHAWLGTRLPAAMVPSPFLFLDSLPLAPSGKVDRIAIRLRVTPSSESRESDEPPPEAMNATERLIANIWQKLLQVPAVALDDHFLAIGGDSLAAVKMITEIEEALHISLPVQIAFEAPTLRRLAARVGRVSEQTPDSVESSYLFPLVERGRGPAVFFSNVDLRLALRGTWRAPCSLYSISHWAQGRGFLKAKSVGELAATHIERIRRLQPFGPYRLAGFSFGGLVALEMARQFRAAGETVDFLLLLDPMLPYRTESAPAGVAMEGRVTPLDESMGRRVARHARALARRPSSLGPYVWDRVRWHVRYNPLKQWVIFNLVHLHGQRPNPVSQLIVPRNRWPAFWYSARRMAETYVAQRHQGPMMAVFPDSGQRYQAWKDLLDPSADVRFVSANHHALFEDPALSLWLRPWEGHLAGVAAR